MKVIHLISMRILGVDLPQRKRVLIGLQYIYGVGPVLAKQICQDLNIEDSMRIQNMPEDLVSKVVEYITEKGKESKDGKWKVEGDLRRKISADITRLHHIGCRRGMRLRSRLPVHGQRTKSNARNAKGKAGATAITRKKK